nr:GNAT family N-acetyltransferase [Ammoniphilus sp. CFH 90114]
MDIRYTRDVPSPQDLFELYDAVRWNNYLKSPPEKLHQAMVQSWCVMSAYDSRNKLIGTGRVISDGTIQALICGLVVHPEHQGRGIGKELFNRLVEKCRKDSLHIQLLCTEALVPYYKRLGFETFATGMKDKVMPKIDQAGAM